MRKSSVGKKHSNWRANSGTKFFRGMLSLYGAHYRKAGLSGGCEVWQAIARARKDVPFWTDYFAGQKRIPDHKTMAQRIRTALDNKIKSPKEHPMDHEAGKRYNRLIDEVYLTQNRVLSKEELDTALSKIDAGATAAIAAKSASKLKSPRKEFTNDTKKEICDFTIKVYGGKCPCCKMATILVKNSDDEWKVVKENGKVVAEFDHWNSNHQNGLRNCWLICKPCHRKMDWHTEAGQMARTENAHMWKDFQLQLGVWLIK